MITSLSRKDIDEHLPHRSNIDRFIGAEVERYSDKPGNIIGAIAEGTANRKWGYAILRRDDNGKYRFWDLETRIESCDAARRQIIRAMEATQKDGQACSPVVG